MRRKLLFPLLLIVTLMHIFCMRWLGENFNSKKILKSLIDEQRVHLLDNWEVQLLFCPEEGTPSSLCESTEKQLATSIKFPALKETRALLKQGKENRAILKHRISPSTRQWIAKNRVVALVVPQSLQWSAKMLLDSGKTQEIFGLGSNLAFHLSEQFDGRNALSEKNTLELELDLNRNLQLPLGFGPMLYPIALAEPTAVDEYLYLGNKDTIGVYFQTTLVTLITVLSLFCAFFLRSRPIAALAIYLSLRATRAFISVFILHSFDFSAVIYPFLFVTEAAMLAALYRFCELIFHPEENLEKTYAWYLIPVGVIAALCAQAFMGSDIIEPIVLLDTVSGMLSLAAVCCGIVISFTKRWVRKYPGMTISNFLNWNKISVFISAILLIGCGIHAIAAYDNFSLVLQGKPKSYLDWRLQSLFSSMFLSVFIWLDSNNRQLAKKHEISERRRKLILSASRRFISDEIEFKVVKNLNATIEKCISRISLRLCIILNDIPYLYSDNITLALRTPDEHRIYAFYKINIRADEEKVLDSFIFESKNTINTNQISIKTIYFSEGKLNIPLWHQDELLGILHLNCPTDPMLNEADKEFILAVLTSCSADVYMFLLLYRMTNFSTSPKTA